MSKIDIDTKISKQCLLDKISKMMNERERILSSLVDVIVAKIGINRTDFRIIDTLLLGPASPSLLVKETGISPSAMTSALDRLEAQHLIIRKHDLKDRRKIIVDSTDNLKRINSNINDLIVADQIEFLSSFNLAELQIIYNFFCMDIDIYKKHKHRLIKENSKKRITSVFVK